MNSTASGAYSGVLGEEEMEFLSVLADPARVSRQILDALVLRYGQITRLFDAGAGTDPRLAADCNSLGIEYHFSEPGTKMAQGRYINMASILENKLKAAHIPHSGTTTRLPGFPSDAGFGAADVVHMRAVLMHLPWRDQVRSLTAAYSYATKAVVMIDYDWSAGMTSTTHPQEIAEFTRLAFALMGFAGINPYMGRQHQSILTLAAEDGFDATFPGSEIETLSFPRQEDNYTAELLALGRDMYLAASRMALAEVVNGLRAWRWRAQESPIRFVPAPLCAMIIHKPQ